jgi:hypothetical protein
MLTEEAYGASNPPNRLRGAMEKRAFRLVALDEGGVALSRDNDNLRLVCLIDGGGKLAIWGRDGQTGNIDRVYAALPCRVECECIPPERWATRFGHSYWVPQGAGLKVLAD